MTEEELKHIETIVNQEIENTKQAIINYKALTKPIAPENAIGRVSRMDAINNKAVNDDALEKAELKLKNLQITYTNIHDADFGVCHKCKNNIPLGRIMLMPQSRFCVNCAR